MQWSFFSMLLVPPTFTSTTLPPILGFLGTAFTTFTLLPDASLLNTGNSSSPSNCGKCSDLELWLLQALSELSSVQLIVDLLNEYKYKQDEKTFDMVRNDYWTQATSNHQKKA